MNAIHKGKLYNVVNDSMAGVKLEPYGFEGKSKWVLYSDEDLLIDPTDDEIQQQKTKALAQSK